MVAVVEVVRGAEMLEMLQQGGAQKGGGRILSYLFSDLI
jgi:hypothetical protein